MNIITRMVTKFTGSMLLMVLLTTNGAFACGGSGMLCTPSDDCCSGQCSEGYCTDDFK